MIPPKLTLHPEKFARLLISKRKLTPPIDVDALVSEYANLVYDEIPVKGIDGVSINIKVPGKKPTVVVNNNMPRTRQRFTLAHELGHIIIPWHVGDLIIDLIHEDGGLYKDLWAHQEIERQANYFAAELLMPADWVKNLFNSTQDLATIHQIVSDTCQVSPIAAALRIIDLHESAIAFCETDFLNFIKSFGQSNKSKLINLEIGKRLKNDHFDSIQNDHSKKMFNDSYYHWWVFQNESLGQHYTDDRTWRELLDQILEDCQIENPKNMKFRLNGVIAHENGALKRLELEYNPANLFASTLRRLIRDEFKDISKHPKFKEFVAKRISDFF